MGFISAFVNLGSIGSTTKWHTYIWKHRNKLKNWLLVLRYKRHNTLNQLFLNKQYSIH